MDYKKSGVDIEKGDQFVESIRSLIGDTYDNRVVSGVGGFAALYEIDEDRLLAAGTDGVGTKVKIAQALNIHHTIGQDLVAMCVNDLLCTGARPLFFLDYLATGVLDLAVGREIIKGIARACKESGCALIGGETAEMPGVYTEGVYDLAGFAVGELRRTDWIDGSQVDVEQTIIGLPSSGFHSNGFSLIRKLVNQSEVSLLAELLTPTKLYVKLIHALLKEQRENITGIAHITGGGIDNIPRISETVGYDLTHWPEVLSLPRFMQEVISRTTMNRLELHQTFNMGVGLVVLVKDQEKLARSLKSLNEPFFVLGKTTNQFKGVRI